MKVQKSKKYFLKTSERQDRIYFFLSLFLFFFMIESHFKFMYVRSHIRFEPMTIYLRVGRYAHLAIVPLVLEQQIFWLDFSDLNF